ncbi:MAG: peptide deformylase [candidate division Zixibacteria bacterium]|nr:peptide deformylase [candidate division Zixibacteria bacterium]
MSVREIITLGHPALWKKAEKVNDVADDSVKALMTDLRDTLLDFLKRNGFGRGIAAPQINVLKRIVYVVMPDGSFDGPLINPEIVATEGDLVPVWDDCFSLPGLKVKVSRFDKIRVEYLNEKEQKHTLKAEGGLAELLQHEIDHLDGILATDRAASPRDLVSVVEWERRFRKEESS